MSSKPITKLAFLIAVLALFGGAVSASAGYNLGTVYVGGTASTTVTGSNSSSVSLSISSVTMPYGFSHGYYTPGAIPPYGTYYVDVYANTSTPGTFSGYMRIDFATADWPFTFVGSEYIYLTVKVVEPCDPLSVSITGPTQGSTKTPNAAGNVILSANASASADRVAFYVDGVQVANDVDSPWAYAWPAKDGSHQVYAKAYDSCGNSLTSSIVSFSVNCGAPSVTLTSPANGSTVTPNAAGNVILEASASHSTGIQKVRFFIDGGLVATDTTAPYAYAWPATSGTHVAQARAFSNCGGSGVTSNSAWFTVP